MYQRQPTTQRDVINLLLGLFFIGLQLFQLFALPHLAFTPKPGLGLVAAIPNGAHHLMVGFYSRVHPWLPVFQQAS